MARKIYVGPQVDVSYDGGVCQHAAECIRGMPSVFDVSSRPWINPEQATTSELAAELRDVVARCPSGALEIVEHSEGD
jgi:uncharacterized Fe-S cluster protein YjdI